MSWVSTRNRDKFPIIVIEISQRWITWELCKVNFSTTNDRCDLNQVTLVRICPIYLYPLQKRITDPGLTRVIQLISVLGNDMSLPIQRAVIHR